MNVMIEEAGPCKKVLKFEIPRETVDSELEKKTREVCDTIEIPGFRKGRAPRKLVEKRFANQIRDEVKQSVVGDSYQKALEEHKISPVGDPKFGEIKMESGQPLNFDVTLEVLPTFDVEHYKGIQLKKKSAAVTEEDLDRALKEFAARKAQMTVVKDGVVKRGDQVICDCRVEVKGNNILEDEDIELFVAEGMTVAGISLPDLIAVMEGKKSGDESKVSVKLPDNFVKEEHRGNDARVTLVIKEIKRLALPEISEEFAKTLGFESLDDLKAKLRKQIEIDKKKWVEDDLRNQILDTLLNQIQLVLPQDFVNYQTEQRVYKHQMDLLNKGMPLDEIQKRTESIKNASSESVMRELKASLILHHIADKEKMFVTESEVENRIVEIARAYNTDVVRVRKQLERHGNLSYLRSDMRENKMLDVLVKEAKISEEG
ncbi:MAG TPA: trigger factor [Candidatus Brocadiaceae bacterium]